MSALPKHYYTLEEYLELDRNSEERLEYWDGEIFSMSGASDQHDNIETNVITYLNLRLGPKGCRTFTGNFRIKVPSLPPYRYGDSSALCGKPVFEKIGGVDTLTNPQLIIEILSPSTKDYDLGTKFTNYKSIPSFCEYLVISQTTPHVIQFNKQSSNAWRQKEFTSMDNELELASVGCKLSLAEIYQYVIFPASEDDDEDE